MSLILVSCENFSLIVIVVQERSPVVVIVCDRVDFLDSYQECQIQ
jgi:hypothetical protein